MLLQKWLRGCCLSPIHHATASKPRASLRADTQLAKAEGEREMRQVAAHTEEDTDAEIQALTQKCAAFCMLGSGGSMHSRSRQQRETHQAFFVHYLSAA